MNRRCRVPVRLSILLLVGLMAAGRTAAHPMGNFSVNHYALLMPGTHAVELLYVLDLAELPTLELLRGWGLTKTSRHAELEAKARAQAVEWMGKLVFVRNGSRVNPVLGRTDFAIQDGAGGLAVIRIEAHLKVIGEPGAFFYEDRNYVERAGWKEVVVEARPGARLTEATPGASDRSRALTAYPQDVSLPAPRDVTAEFSYVAGSPLATEMHPDEHSVKRGATPAEANSQGTVRRDDFLSRTLQGGRGPLRLGLVLACLAAAFGIGTLHAAEPGHGKTMVAAYLVGSRGTYRQAIFLGGMVTFTHTISVFLLGVVSLFLSQYLLPESLIRAMGLISGLSIVWIGGLLLYKRARTLVKVGEHSHSHPHTHEHSHPHARSHPVDQNVTLGDLVALGVSGGLVPCPAALVLLLSCVSLGRPGFGLLLLLFFSLGLALVLMTIGMVVLAMKKAVPSSEKRGDLQALARYAPVLSAVLILAIGIYMTGVAAGAFTVVRLIG